MKRILIFSDTHNDINPCIRLLMNMKDVDAIIHAGDCVRDAEDLHYAFPDIPMHYVRGNNDFLSGAPDKLTVTIGGKKILIVHGHMERVKYDLSLSTLTEKGEQTNADLVVFGHTHMPRTEYRGKMIILNPGSVRFTRTYAVAEIEDDVLKTSIINI